jgi:hypothetical protein
MRRHLIAALCMLAGCLDVFEQPEVGALATDPSCDLDGDATTEASFARDVAPILRGKCESCHQPGGSGELSSGLDVTSYDALLAGGSRSVDTIVIAGRPCTSVLYQKVTDAPPFGARMPRGRAPLSTAEQSIIHDWIAERAPNN